MFKHRTNEKDVVYAPMEYNPNGKGITAPKEYVLMIHSMVWFGKGMVLQKIV